MKTKIYTYIMLIIALFSSVNATEVTIKPLQKHSNNYEVYAVQKGDTLMIISFRIYGDYRRWKDLAKANPDLKNSNYDLTNIKKINFEVPTSSFKWEPLGEQYLIKHNDTLGSISKDFYNTSRRWKEIYHNNRPLIRWPNLIFAGFTIYYVPDPVTKPIE